MEGGREGEKRKNDQEKNICLGQTSSTYLSASSSTRISMVLRLNEGALWMWSTSLPGVAMMISGLLRRTASWLRLSNPPVGGMKGKRRQGGREEGVGEERRQREKDGIV